jgi:hypothetical protein
LQNSRTVVYLISTMKTLFLFLSLLILVSCENNSTKEPINTTPLADTIAESAAAPVEESSTSESPLTFLEEDSLAFVNSTEQERAIIEKYCACTKKNGNQSRECRVFIKELSIHQAVTDKLRNKYFYNERVSSQLGKIINELDDKFNACSN